MEKRKKENLEKKKVNLKRSKLGVVVKKPLVSKPLLKKGILKKKILKSSAGKKILKKEVKKKIIKTPQKEKVSPAVAQSKGIETKGINDVLRIIGKKDYFEIYKKIISVDKKYFDNGFERTFENKKELDLFFKERVLDFFNSRYSDIRSKISTLRKGGIGEVDYYDLKSLSIPLKLKTLEVEFSLELFEKIFDLVVYLETELGKFKLEED